ncbi:hypothetical protein [Nitrosospira multiformis]|uniref:hypothetical protein n=1 Tax=Nitrosospira multiformis TaxID=1231 RepID=UPI000D2F7E49|nr:hypothetical protein [Nitrosospira multiformis]
MIGSPFGHFPDDSYLTSVLLQLYETVQAQEPEMEIKERKKRRRWRTFIPAAVIDRSPGMRGRTGAKATGAFALKQNLNPAG